MLKSKFSIRFLIAIIAVGMGVVSYAQQTTPTNASLFAAAMQNGKKVYEKNCMVCHQKDGGGVQNLNPPLIQTKYVVGNTTTLINILLKGMNEEIEIDGDTYANPMPAQAHLSNQEIADVLTFIRNSFANKATMVTVADVKKLRIKK